MKDSVVMCDGCPDGTLGGKTTVCDNMSVGWIGLKRPNLGTVVFIQAVDKPIIRSEKDFFSHNRRRESNGTLCFERPANGTVVYIQTIKNFFRGGSKIGFVSTDQNGAGKIETGGGFRDSSLLSHCIFAFFVLKCWLESGNGRHK